MSILSKLSDLKTLYTIPRWLPTADCDIFYNAYKQPGIVTESEFSEAQQQKIDFYEGGIKTRLKATFEYGCNCKVISITIHNIAPGKQKPTSYKIPYEAETLVVINTKNGELLTTKDPNGIEFIDLESYNWDQFIVIVLSI